MKAIIDQTIYDTDNAELVLRYSPWGRLSRWIKYPLYEIYCSNRMGLYFKVVMYKKRKKIKEMEKLRVKFLVEKYFHEDSEVFKKHGPILWRA